jgi:trehalose 6-phosphate phosphatase
MFSDEMTAVVEDPGGTLLALDFDGTLAPIVGDPTRAHGHPRAFDALARLGTRVGQIAIVTGRPVEQVVRLGGLLGRPGLERLIVCGQYGAERWNAVEGAPASSPVLPPVRRAVDVLPDWLATHGAAGARIEPKGLAVAVHTRGMGPGVRDSLVVPLTELAIELGLVVELGREVIELRAGGWDKGRVLDELVRELGVRHVVFAGDDLGDVAAFDAVDRMRRSGIGGLLVCSASDEQPVLADRADVVLDGPDGVAAWLTGLADAIEISLEQERPSP